MFHYFTPYHTQVRFMHLIFYAILSLLFSNSCKYKGSISTHSFTLLPPATSHANVPFKTIHLSHNHHFKWWFELALIRAGYMLAQKGGYRKHCYWSAYKTVLLESSFLDSSACSLIYFFIASSVILPIVET